VNPTGPLDGGAAGRQAGVLMSEATRGAAGLPVLDETRLRQLVPMTAAIVALEAALYDGSAPGVTPARTSILTQAGQVLLMPAATSRFVGVKLVSIAPENPAIGKPRIQGVYVLMDAISLTPIALVDGVALTSLRTPATSAVAVRRLAVRGGVRLVVIGTGPQAYGHVEAVQTVRPLTHLTLVGRDRSRAEAMASWAANLGVPVEVVAGADLADGLEAPVRSADVVVCATTSRWPILDGDWLTDDAVVVAVGSHEPDAREVDSSVVLRSTVIVESRETALREAGDILIPIRDGECGPEVIAGDLSQLVKGHLRIPEGRPRFFKGCGEAWQDLVVASAAHDRLQSEHTPPFGERTGW
jgi:ornithine cyclodeaminase/alanine dehydrogenase-like protein (mu-crystallin family)